MIFYFDMNFDEIDDVPDFEYKMGMLLQNHREGKLLLILKRDQYEWASKNLNFNMKNRSMLNNIGSHISMTNALLKSNSIKSKIVLGGEKYIDSSGGVVVGIKCPYFSSVIDSPVLVVENVLSDGFFIKKILYNLKGEGFADSQINLFLTSGNGSQVDAHADEYIQSGRIVAKLKDSDITSPFNNIPNFSIDGFCYGFILPCHEIENLFCEDVIGIVYKNNSEFNKTLDMLRVIKENEEGESYFFFFDLKKGISKEKINSLPDGDEKKWICQKLSYACDITSNFEYIGFGDSLCKNVKSNNQAIVAFIKNMKSSVWKEFFFDFFQRMKWIFIAATASRT